MMKKSIFILHPGKANYPEIEAYTSYFESRFNVYSGTINEYESFADKDNCILWCIMGMYTKKLQAKYLIHDYRSLSVGRFAYFKDMLKKKLNIKPDLRIFQNQVMSDVMGFNDGIKEILLPMGVPNFISEITVHTDRNFHQKFCYIGEMSRERNFDRVLDAYVSNYKNDKLVLIGTPEPYILEKYQQFPQLMFVGRKPQRETLSIVKSCEFAVCYFPYHRPHKFQAPTKLLEYMALGVNVLCNDSPSNLRELERYSYKAVVSKSADVFSGLILSHDSIHLTTILGLEWDSVIKNSGVPSYLEGGK
jgi:glycosyltransferase involved in cell wall biosynthesis